MDATKIMDTETLDYFINHFFLPPKLPDEDDSSSDIASDHKRSLISFIATALEEYGRSIAPDGEKRLWESCRGMVDRMHRTRTDDYALHFDELFKEFQGLKPGGK
jgi:hypothetical protein